MLIFKESYESNNYILNNAVHLMSLLVIAIDRDNDLGRKTGIRSPVIGRDANVKAALELGLADPEESDTNTMLAAISAYDQLLEKNPNVAEEIEKAVREKAAAITKELEGNPSPKEKISKDEEK